MGYEVIWVALALLVIVAAAGIWRGLRVEDRTDANDHYSQGGPGADG